MICVKKISTGRLGNRLFHYHFLRQIAKKTGLEYFHPSWPDKKYFLELTNKRSPLFSFRKKVHFSSPDILKLSSADFLKLVEEFDIQARDVVLGGPLLGEVFFDYLFYPPSDFLKIKEEFKIDFAFNDQRIIIGLHFRGTDFKAWNPQASLEFPYYQEAINYCRDFYKDQALAFVLFTDDLKFPAFQETIFFLKSLKQEFQIGDNRRPPIIDFYQMSQCDVLISSPSTFAVLAGCLGKPKKIIHNQAWLDYAIGKNDKFWVDLSKTTNPYYSLWKTF